MNPAPTPPRMTLVHRVSGASCTVTSSHAVEAAKLIDQLPLALRQEAIRAIQSMHAAACAKP